MGKQPKPLTLDKAKAICIGAGIKLGTDVQEWCVGFQPSEKVIRASALLHSAGFRTEWVKPQDVK